MTFTKDDPRINRAGRPPHWRSLSDKYRYFLESQDDNFDGTKEDHLLRALFLDAIDGNVRAAEVILERAYGKVPDKIEITPKKALNLTNLSDDELKLLEDLTTKAQDD